MAQVRSPSRTEQVKPSRPETTIQAQVPQLDRRDRIAAAAYHRWQARGGGHGKDQQDWFEAESEIDGGKVR